MRPLVSVLVTSYNREQYIGETLDSILRCEYENVEIVVVDDASTDNTVAVAKQYAAADSRIQVFVNDHNLGQFANRNKAAALARGKYLKYLDSDDRILKGSLSLMVDAMEKYQQAAFGMSFNNTSSLPSGEDFPYFLPAAEAYCWHFEKGGLLFRGPSHVIFRADRFKDIGGFPLDMGTHGDTGINLRMAAAGGVVLCKPGLINWRRHEGQVAAGQDRNAAEMLQQRLQIHRRLLDEAACPLNQKQKHRILLSMQVMYLRAAAGRHLFRDGFGSFMKLLSKKTVPFYKLPLALIPLRLLRRLYGN